MVKGDFDRRISDLARAVGDGALQGRVTVNQKYALYQHEELRLRHAPGRIPRYLAVPLFANHRHYLQTLAGAVLGGDLAGAMADSMEHLSDEVERLAPIDFNDLPRSGHPVVTDGQRTVYDRPPIVPRLTDEQLREKARLRARMRRD